jgi:endonuclease/exonuclease/phosphatase family metal-dependent hydrolase
MQPRRNNVLNQLCLAFVIVLLIASFGHLPSPALGSTTEDSRYIRVMTFNIRCGTADDGPNHWQKRRKLVFDVLRNHKPDVVGLQEALRFQIDEIHSALPVYGKIGIGRDDGKTKGEYCAILYDITRFTIDESGTFWFSDTPQVPGSITWGNACTRICTWARLIEKKTSLAFYLYNLHLDHISQEANEKSAVLLAKRIQGRKRPDPFIVTGDFNSGEDDSVIAYLTGKKPLNDTGRESMCPLTMADTFRTLHPNATGIGTFNEFTGNRQGKKIDFVFTTPDTKIKDAQIIYDNEEGRFPSDHFPVTATIKY